MQLSHLTGVDFFISYWKIGPVAHTFVSFIFDNAPPVNISIELDRKWESFDLLTSLFKQFELIYVVGDERDIVRVRTNYRDEDVLCTALTWRRPMRAGSSRFICSGSISSPISPSFTIC